MQYLVRNFSGKDIVKVDPTLFRRFLATGAKTGRDLQSLMGISQASLSRLSQQSRDFVLMLGAARATSYALRSPLKGLGAEIPVFTVDRRGDVTPAATLHPLVANQYGWQRKDSRPQLLHRLPYMIRNMIPEGFMGRAFAIQAAKALSLPPKLTDWTERDALVALASRGEDCLGNVIVGEESVQRYLRQVHFGDQEPIPLGAREQAFSSLAQRALKGDVPASSAGGEQPKFTAAVETPEGPLQVIVKFASRQTSEGQRWSDLLVCEHLAAEILRAAGFAAAATEIVQTAEWTFLQSVRFDRVGRWGRFPVVTMKAFAGDWPNYVESWGKAADCLAVEGRLSAEAVKKIKWLESYGTLLGNTDMHLGNLSLIPDEDGRFALAPVYDMTPMAYRPKPGGYLPGEPLTVIPSLAEDEPRQCAIQTWEKIAADPRISVGIWNVCAENISLLREAERGPRLKY